MILFEKPLSQKLTASILIICLVGSIAGVILFLPKKAQAQCPVYVIQDNTEQQHISLQSAWEALKSAFRSQNLATLGSMLIEEIWENAQRLVKWALGVFLNMLLHQILAALTNDIINWIQNGGEPRFLSMRFDDWLWDAVSKAGGEFISQYLGAGWLCEPFDFEIEAALLNVNPFEQEVECTLDDIVGNIQNFYDDFSQGGWAGWVEMTSPKNNFYGALLLAQDQEKLRLEQEQEERDKELEMGQGFLSPKDCYWYDANSNLIATQNDVIGTPPMPPECEATPDPGDPPGTTVGGFQGPCQKRCEILTPAKSVERVTGKAVTNYFDTINAQITGAVVKAGPYDVYVQAIINALINRVLTEGVGLLRSAAGGGSGAVPAPDQPIGVPQYGMIGAADVIQVDQIIANPQQALQQIAQADALASQLISVQQNLQTMVLVAQQDTLAVLRQTRTAYQNALPWLQNVITQCQDTPFAAFVNWARATRNSINNNIIPTLNQQINQVQNVDIPNTNNIIGNINTAIASIQNYQTEANNWISVYNSVNGDVNDPALQAASVTLQAAFVQAVNDTQTPLSQVNGVSTANDFPGLTIEAQNGVVNVVSTWTGLVQQLGTPQFPAAGTLYAQLQSAQGIINTASSYINQCAQWHAQQQIIPWIMP